MPASIVLPEGHAVTFEVCPSCGESDIRVEHGQDEHGLPLHLEVCRECGESIVIVGYDCPSCARPNKGLEPTP